MFKNISIGALVAVVAVLGVLAFKNPTVISIPTDLKVDMSSLGSKQQPVVVNVPEQAAPVVNVNVPKQTLGAVSGPDSFYEYFGVNGLRTYSDSIDFTSATTTVCAIQGPTATSTLMSAGALFTTSSTSASTVTIAKSATAFATTTVLGQGALAANAQGFLLASTTATTAGGTGSNLNPAYVFGPSQWLVVGMQGGAGTFSPVGQCYAQFIAVE